MDAQTLRDVMSTPGLPDGYYTRLIDGYNNAMRAANITTIDRAAMWAAQLGHESVGLKYMEEIASGVAYNGRRDLGNIHPGDGPRFKGRGPIQLTGRNNYRAFTRWANANGHSNIDFEANPQKLSEPQWGFLAASYYWTVARPQINALSDARKLEAVTRAINGGLNGLADRRNRYNRALTFGARLLPDAGQGNSTVSGPKVVHPMGESNGTWRESSGYGSRWGTFHAGMDYAAPIGTPIYAAADGIVVQGADRAPGSVSGFGNWVWIDAQSTCGRDFIYGHMRHASILVRHGDRVKAGQKIAEVGNEGQSTGPHLHFEVWGSPGRLGGKHENPKTWLANNITKGGLTVSEKNEILAEIKASESRVKKYIADFTKGFNGPIGQDVKDIRQQLTGGRDAGEYPGWPQLGQDDQGRDLTVVDGVAAVRYDNVELRRELAALREKLEQEAGN